MKTTKILLGSLPAVAFVFLTHPVIAVPKDGRVTQIVREVKLLPAGDDPRPASVNDRVPQDTAVRTGERSRSELTFADLTISRLGANTIFSYNRAGRNVDLSGGSVLLRVPKDSGGANINASAVSVAVTGTTVILETSGGGRSKLLVLEGGARLSLVKYPAQRRNVQAGQMLDVPAGATTLPLPVKIDLRRTLKEHPLLADFPPLPSQQLILAAADSPPPPDEPVYQGRAVAGQPGGIGPIFPGFPPVLIGGRGNVGNPTGRGNATNPNASGQTSKGATTRNSGAAVKQPTPRPRGHKPSPNDTPPVIR